MRSIILVTIAALAFVSATTAATCENHVAASCGYARAVS